MVPLSRHLSKPYPSLLYEWMTEQWSQLKKGKEQKISHSNVEMTKIQYIAPEAIYQYTRYGRKWIKNGSCLAIANTTNRHEQIATIWYTTVMIKVKIKVVHICLQLTHYSLLFLSYFFFFFVASCLRSFITFQMFDFTIFSLSFIHAVLALGTDTFFYGKLFYTRTPLSALFRSVWHNKFTWR